MISSNRNPLKSPRAKLTLVSGLVAPVAETVSAQQFAVTDLGALGGANSRAYSMNRQSDVAGMASTADGKERAFLLTRAHD